MNNKSAVVGVVSSRFVPRSAPNVYSLLFLNRMKRLFGYSSFVKDENICLIS